MNPFKFYNLTMIPSALALIMAFTGCHVADTKALEPQNAPTEFTAPMPADFKVRLLPGQSGVVFTMGGAPENLDEFKQLVGVMREQSLGNGFEPGPSLRPKNKPLFDYLATVGWYVTPALWKGDLQVKGGSALSLNDVAPLKSLDDAGLSPYFVLAEWGYYFHSLSHNEEWFKAVYGKDFDQRKHLMKPKGLSGYDKMPASKQECYDAVKDYYMSRSRDLLRRMTSATHHDHYEAYVGEWGSPTIGLSLGENAAFTQSKLAFGRGAARQWQKPWTVSVSPWFSGACTTRGPLRGEGVEARGLDSGHSLSFYERIWLHAWFAGAALVTPENSSVIFFEAFKAPWTLSEHGRKAADVFRFMKAHDRGVPYTPVAIVLDHLAGYNGYKDKPWGILEPTVGDRQLRDLFDYQLFPGSDHIHQGLNPTNPEASYLVATPYGEIFDVQLSNASEAMLGSYPVLLLAGDITFDDSFIGKLEGALKRGHSVLVSAAHQSAMGSQAFARLAGYPRLEVLEAWTNSVTSRPAAVSDTRLRRLADEALPVTVTGAPVQYQVNRTSAGWVIELVNNTGVIKRPDKPQIVDTNAVASVTIRPKVAVASAREWRSNQRYTQPGDIQVNVGPGQSAFVELTVGTEK